MFFYFPKIFLFSVLLTASTIQNCFEIKIYYFFLFLVLIFKFLIIIHAKLKGIKNYYLKEFYKDFLFIFFSFFLNFFVEKRIFHFKENLKSDFLKLKNYKFLSGKITEKEEKNNKYHYLIKLKSKFLKNNYYIKLISKKNFNNFSKIKIENFHWLNKPNELNKDFLENFFKTKIFLFCVSNKILISNNCKDSFFHKTKIFFFSFFEKLKEKIINSFENNFNEKDKEFIKSIFLGKNDFKEVDDYLKFKKWGIIHYLSRSGLHANIISSLFSSFSLLFFFDFIKIQIFSFLFLLIFYLITFNSISFKRAFFTYFLYFFCKIRGVSTTPLHIFSFCLSFFLLIDPFYIYDIGFNLSFFSSGILSFLSYIKNFKK